LNNKRGENKKRIIMDNLCKVKLINLRARICKLKLKKKKSRSKTSIPS